MKKWLWLFITALIPPYSFGFAVIPVAQFIKQTPVGFKNVGVYKILKTNSNEKVSITAFPGVSLACNTCNDDNTTCYTKFTFTSSSPQYLTGSINFTNQFSQVVTVPVDITTINEPLTVEALLQYVAWGLENSVIKILTANPALALMKGAVTDYSGRTFKNITAFQYALWAYDRHMWQTINAFLTKQSAKVQLLDLEANATEHGIHYDYQPIMDAYEILDKAQIKKLQRLVPVHFANEWTRTTPVLYPTPSFTDKSLPRNMLDNIYPCQTWFPFEANQGTGYDFVYGRGMAEYAWGNTLLNPADRHVPWYFAVDRAAVRNLFSIRVKEYAILKTSLGIPDKNIESHEKSKNNFININ